MAVERLFLVCLFVVFVTIPVISTLLGGYEAAAKTDKGVQRAVSFAVDELNKQTNSIYYMKNGEILAASFQVVAGKNYRVTFEFVATECKKNGEAPGNLATCKVLGGRNGKTEICEVFVFEQEWKNYRELKSFHCKDATGKSATKN